jgi:RND family efflux transporter MFP subunit
MSALVATLIAAALCSATGVFAAADAAKPGPADLSRPPSTDPSRPPSADLSPHAVASLAAQAFNGLLLPASTALIKTKYDEQVAEVAVEVGSRVSAGQTLLRLVDDEQRVTRDRAAALTDRARAELKRLDALRKSEGTSDQLLEQAQTALRVAEADLQLAEIRFKERTIKAPFTGIVAERYVDPGASVQEGDPLVRVTAVTPLRLEALLPEEMLSRMRGHARVEVSLTAPDTVLVLPVRLGTVLVDPASGTFPLHITIDNTQGRLTPGASCTLRILPAQAGVPGGSTAPPATTADRSP